MPFYRVSVQVPDAYVDRIRATHPERTQPVLLADIEGRVSRLAKLCTILTTMQDPTGPRMGTYTPFTIVGQCTAPPAVGAHDDAVRIVRVQEVEPPPSALLREGTNIPWDSGLTANEVSMIENALLNERNPRHLHGIAATLEPYFPAAASVLDAKGDLVEHKIMMDREASRELEQAIAANPLTPAQTRALVEARDALFAYAARMQIPEMIVREEVKRIAGSLIDPDGSRQTTMPAALPLARQLTREIRVQGRPLRIVCPYAVREALPPHPEDGALNETSVQLALGSMKPKMARIGNEGMIPNRLRQLNLPQVRLDMGRPLMLSERKALRALANMERAKQAIERRRWEDWYRRRERAYGSVA